ncbi:cytochrome o ubiquinol oxidase subunit IV [Inquilinus sp.]|uniref:cytochrome o ubiquinol oxidase subunit IV n=1 Tax=Inquilinus sp. TaxID=1932117 RepID=UPI0031E3E233
MSTPDLDRLHAGTLHHRADHAPGDEPPEESGHWVRNANLGLAFSIVLTAAAFLLAGSDVIYPPAVPVALIVLAIAQMGVHLVFFLHVTTGPDNTNNVLALAFGVLVVALIVVGSIWIMDHLTQNMMLMDQMMQMQP